MGSNSFIGEDQVGPAPWGRKVSASESASLSVIMCSGRGYQQSVQEDSLMFEHEFDLNSLPEIEDMPRSPFTARLQ